MNRRHHHPKSHLEIFPASMLKDRQRWRMVSECLPPHSYLLVSTVKNPRQTRLVLRLERSLKRRGRRVSVVSI